MGSFTGQKVLSALRPRVFHTFRVRSRHTHHNVLPIYGHN